MVNIKTCAAGYGHSVALTDRGDLYSWGFNTYGQVGLGDKTTHWTPELVQFAKNDGILVQLQPIIKVACSQYATFAIDQAGVPFSWGKGFVGHQRETRHEYPCRIVHNTVNRIFTDVFTNGDAALLFAPVRVH